MLKIGKRVRIERKCAKNFMGLEIGIRAKNKKKLKVEMCKNMLMFVKV